MLKYAGICILSVSMAIYGVIKSSEIKKSLTLRKSVAELLCYIENNVTYAGKSKNDIYKSFSPSCNQVSSFLIDLSNDGNIRESINKHLDILNKEDRRMLETFFTEFGKSTRREKEAKSCRLFREEFEKQGIDTEKEQMNKILLYRKLGIIFALITAVIFL